MSWVNVGVRRSLTARPTTTSICSICDSLIAKPDTAYNLKRGMLMKMAAPQDGFFRYRFNCFWGRHLYLFLPAGIHVVMPRNSRRSGWRHCVADHSMPLG